MDIEEKSGGVDGELASDPWSDTSDGVRRMVRGEWDSGDSGETDGRVVGRWYGMEETFLRLERGMSMFRVRGTVVGDGWGWAVFGRDLWDTATDVSSLGETRRGREGESWEVGLGIEVVRGRGRGFCAAFGDSEGFLPWGEGGPSDKRENMPTNSPRSRSETVLDLYPELLSNLGTCVTRETGSGRAGGG